MRNSPLQSTPDQQLHAWVAEGKTSFEIGDLVGCDYRTVNARLRRIGATANAPCKPVPEAFEDEVKRRWMAGESGSTIARALNATRNRVVSPAHRRKWPRSPDVAAQNQIAETRRYRGPATAKKPKLITAHVGIAGNGATFEHAPAAPFVQKPQVATGEPCRIIDDRFSRSACKWPINDPGRGRMEETLFCQGRVEAGDTRYCKHHRDRALAAVQPKRRADPPPLGSGHGYRYGERKLAR